MKLHAKLLECQWKLKSDFFKYMKVTDLKNAALTNLHYQTELNN